VAEATIGECPFAQHRLRHRLRLIVQPEIIVRFPALQPAPRNKSHGWVSSEKGCLLFIRGAAHGSAHI
jgi:hypothetical protein